jgi:hypothetical protein
VGAIHLLFFALIEALVSALLVQEGGIEEAR